jgi:hypothetical protein
VSPKFQKLGALKFARRTIPPSAEDIEDIRGIPEAIADGDNGQFTLNFVGGQSHQCLSDSPRAAGNPRNLRQGLSGSIADF